MNANEAMVQHFATQFLAPSSLFTPVSTFMYPFCHSFFALLFCWLNGVQLMATFIGVSA